jgi:hypothetical protein
VNQQCAGSFRGGLLEPKISRSLAVSEGWRSYRVLASAGSDHHQINPAVFKAFPCQTIPRHLLDPVPVLTEIARSLVLGWKFGLQAASLARISVCNLKKDRLPPLLCRTRFLVVIWAARNSCSRKRPEKRSLLFGLLNSAFVLAGHRGGRRRQKRIEALLDNGVAFAHAFSKPARSMTWIVPRR